MAAAAAAGDYLLLPAPGGFVDGSGSTSTGGNPEPAGAGILRQNEPEVELTIGGIAVVSLLLCGLWIAFRARVERQRGGAFSGLLSHRPGSAYGEIQ